MDQNSSARVRNILKVLYLSLILQAVVALLFLGYTAVRQVSLAYPAAKLTLYDGPKTMQTSPDTKISVNGNPLFVYETNVNNTHSWVANGNVALEKTPVSYFDFEGKAVVEIAIPNLEGGISSCTVTPASYGITPEIRDGTIRFQIEKPGFYTVEVNGSVKRAVHLFANAPEKDVPDKNDPNVITIGPGEWNVNTISLKSNQTLYLSGGAVVHGMIRSDNADHITIRGRGIVDGSVNPSWVLPGESAKVPVDLRSSKNITMEGLIFLDSNAWVVNCYESQNANLSNLKVISARPNGDGITLQSCTDVQVKDSFVRSWDDSLVVKNYSTNSDNITFDNVLVWTDLAQSCEIGYETNKGSQPNAKISNITFRNITVLHNFHKPVLGIHNSDDALVQRIRYQNIVVEDAQMGSGDAGENKQLIDFAVASSGWSSTPQRGSIQDVTVDGLTVLHGKNPPSRILGYDASHLIQNVTIKNLSILGKKVTSLEDGGFTCNEYAKEIRVE